MSQNVCLSHPPDQMGVEHTKWSENPRKMKPHFMTKWHHERGPPGSPFPLRSGLQMTCHVPGIASGPPVLWTMVYTFGVIKSKKTFAKVKLSLLLTSRF